MSKPIIAIVGRPNVGKSMLFNKIIGRRLSIVEDTPGVTRDRIYGESDWQGRKFTLIDTGGIEPRTDNQILAFMRSQAQIAIDNATVIVFLCDIKTGMTASDQEVASMLQRCGKPVILAVNKVDQGRSPDIYEFYNLGLGDPIAVSAVHGHGTGDLLDACFQFFPPDEEEEEEDDVIKVAVIGKPNVGKSSLINRILGEERVIVSNVAGTTRDAIDTPFTWNGDDFVLVDTAGIRRKRSIDDETVERYSVIRSLGAIRRADVVLIVIDAAEGLSEQDVRIAGYVHEEGKASVVIVNKWDVIEKDTNTMNKFKKGLTTDLAFMSYVPMLFISAKTGQRVNKVLETAKYAYSQNSMRISTGTLNDVISEAVTVTAPPSDKGRQLKIYYAVQFATNPPTFAIVVNDPKIMHFSYQRYLENYIRKSFSLDATPIRIKVRQRGKNDKLNDKA